MRVCVCVELHADYDDFKEFVVNGIEGLINVDVGPDLEKYKFRGNIAATTSSFVGSAVPSASTTTAAAAASALAAPAVVGTVASIAGNDSASQSST
jgi:hypothetical protein